MFKSQKCDRRFGALERLKGVVILEDVRKLHRQLKADDVEPDRVVEILKELDAMPGISRNTLEDVRGLGKDVNRLRKHKNESVAKTAKTLVQKWKLIVKESIDREKRRKKMFGKSGTRKRRSLTSRNSSSSVIRRVRRLRRE